MLLLIKVKTRPETHLLLLLVSMWRNVSCWQNGADISPYLAMLRGAESSRPPGVAGNVAPSRGGRTELCRAAADRGSAHCWRNAGGCGKAYRFPVFRWNIAQQSRHSHCFILTVTTINHPKLQNILSIFVVSKCTKEELKKNILIYSRNSNS